LGPRGRLARLVAQLSKAPLHPSSAMPLQTPSATTSRVRKAGVCTVP
jgi:hypothetical protein